MSRLYRLHTPATMGRTMQILGDSRLTSTDFRKVPLEKFSGTIAIDNGRFHDSTGREKVPEMLTTSYF